MLIAQGVNGEPLEALPLRSLTRMTVSSRYPLDDTPPLDLFDPEDAREAIATAEAVLRWVECLDQPGGDGST
ncbi:MAG: HEPN domain-containing protein [Cyanobacteriota bacterium]